MRPLIEAPHGVDAQVRHVVPQLVEILLREDLWLLRVWAAGHAGDFSMANGRRNTITDDSVDHKLQRFQGSDLLVVVCRFSSTFQELAKAAALYRLPANCNSYKFSIS